MHNEKALIKYFIIKLAIFITAAVLIFVFRTHLVENLKYFIGGLMTAYAIEEIIFCTIFHGSRFHKQGKFFLGIIDLVLGIVLLVCNLPYETICVIWACWSICRESFEIFEIINELKHLLPRILSGVESIAVIVFSIMLILEPGEHHAMIHVYLLLVELVFSPLIPLMDELWPHKKETSEEKTAE